MCVVLTRKRVPPKQTFYQSIINESAFINNLHNTARRKVKVYQGRKLSGKYRSATLFGEGTK